MESQGETGAKATGLPPVIERNIKTLIDRRASEYRSARLDHRMAAAISRFLGSLNFLYVNLLFFFTWIAINAGWINVRIPFDHSFVILAGVVSIESLFLSTFVLISQNRLAAMSEKRADLDLQMSLLSEHEITQLINLVTQIAERMNIADARNPELTDLAQHVAPEQVMDHMEAHEVAEMNRMGL
ncbi:MAG: DUF1003 domain-containing protein [Gemmatimonadota bacterium]